MTDTIGNETWMLQHEADIKKLLPQTWTHVQNVNLLRIGFGLKLLGVEWRSNDELAKCMVLFERCGFMLRDGIQVRAKP